VTWSSTDATSCTASGTWSGAEATSGTLSVTPSASGTASYTLACTGAGGTANGTATLGVAAAAASGSGGKSGGGGAMGLWELAALSLLGVAAQRRRKTALRS
jgi:mevalonate pyrophosphate decarboxylase